MTTQTIVRAPDLAAGLAAVWHAIAAEDARPILGTVCFEPAPDALRLVAADNYRIAMYDVPLVAAEVAGTAQFAGRPVLRRADVKALRAILAPLHGPVTLTVADGRLGVDWKDGNAEFRFMDGTYPDYALILRPEAPPTVTVNPKYLAEAGRAFGKAITVAVEIAGPLSPVVLRGAGIPFVEVIMPVRTAA